MRSNRTHQIILLAFGTVFFLAGCMINHFISETVFDARWVRYRVIGTSFSPTHKFQTLQCPSILLDKNETSTVSATILNASPATLSYSVTVGSPGFLIRSPDQNITLTIPSSKTAQVAWRVTAIETGNHEIVIEALSSEDLKAVDIPSEYRWQTSFREMCGVAVMDNLLTGKQVVLLSLTSMFVGAVLLLIWYDLKIWGRISRRKQFAGLVIPQTLRKSKGLRVVAFYIIQIVLIAIASLALGWGHPLPLGRSLFPDNPLVVIGTSRWLSLIGLMAVYTTVSFVWLDPKIRTHLSGYYLFQIALIVIGAMFWLAFFLTEIGYNSSILVDH